MKRRVRQYSVLMGVCLFLFAGSLPVYYLFGTGWAVAMGAVASVIPPIAMTQATDAGVRFHLGISTGREYAIISWSKPSKKVTAPTMTRALMCQRLIGSRSSLALIVSVVLDMCVDTGVIGVLGLGSQILKSLKTYR